MKNRPWARISNIGYLLLLLFSTILLSIMIIPLFSGFTLEKIIAFLIPLAFDIIIIVRYRYYDFYDTSIVIFYYFTRRKTIISYNNISKVEFGHPIPKGGYAAKFFIQDKILLIPYSDSVFIKRIKAKLAEYNIPQYKITDWGLDPFGGNS